MQLSQQTEAIEGNLMVIQWSSGSDSKDHGWITFTDQVDQF